MSHNFPIDAQGTNNIHPNFTILISQGPGLVFQVYPEALATMRFSALWSVLFFTMVISLGIDSTVSGPNFMDGSLEGADLLEV